MWDNQLTNWTFMLANDFLPMKARRLLATEGFLTFIKEPSV